MEISISEVIQTVDFGERGIVFVKAQKANPDSPGDWGKIFIDNTLGEMRGGLYDTHNVSIKGAIGLLIAPSRSMLGNTTFSTGVDQNANVATN